MTDVGTEPYTLLVPLPAAVIEARMVASALETYSSPWWMARLLTAMDARMPRLTRLREYFRGEQDTWPLHNQGAREAFARTFVDLKANIADPIVTAVVQRLKVEGFRVPVSGPADTAAERQANDAEAWRVWQANGMDAWSVIAMTEALAMGECPIIVDRGPDPRTPSITVEDPMQVIVERDPSNHRRRVAALKRWNELDRSTVVILYLPDRVEWWRADPKGLPKRGYRPVADDAFEMRGRTWRLDASQSGIPPVPGEVPVVTLVNRPLIDGSGQAEHGRVLGLLDGLNKTVLDMLTASEFGAFPQRWATGVDMANEDASIKPAAADGATPPAKPDLESGPGRLWWSENPDARYGQLDASALSGYVEEIDKLVTLIGTASMTPYHWLLNQTSSVPSTGEALKAAERALDGKGDFAQVMFGEAFREVLRLSFLTIGDAARAAAGTEVHWRPTGNPSQAQHVDSLVKLSSIGVDLETILELYPFSPEQISRIRARLAEAGISGQQAETTGALVRGGFDPGDALDATGASDTPGTGP